MMTIRKNIEGSEREEEKYNVRDEKNKKGKIHGPRKNKGKEKIEILNIWYEEEAE